MMNRHRIVHRIVHSFFQYVSFQEPARADQCRRVLAIPSKRYERRLIEYLKPEEIDALLAARTGRPGSAAGTEPCCWWRSKRG